MAIAQRHKKGVLDYATRTSFTVRLTGAQEDNLKCSIFSFDVSANRSRLPLAKNALRKFRTLRHPGIVKVLDTVEVGRYIEKDIGTADLLGNKVDRSTHLHCH